jgi:aminopeptidase C
MINLTIESKAELLALKRALYKAKFLTISFDDTRIVASPFTINLLKKVHKLMVQELKDDLGVKNSWHYIEEDDDVMDVLKLRLKEYLDWVDLDLEEKIELLEAFIAPLNRKDTTISDLITYADEIHNL